MFTPVPPVPDPWLGPSRDGAVLDLVDRAIGLRSIAEAVLGDCAGDGPKGATLARRGGAVAAAYLDIRNQVRALLPGDDGAELVGLLSYHHRMVEEALRMAFRPPSARTERVRRGLARGLGDPADALADLRIAWSARC